MFEATLALRQAGIRSEADYQGRSLKSPFKYYITGTIPFTSLSMKCILFRLGKIIESIRQNI